MILIFYPYRLSLSFILIFYPFFGFLLFVSLWTGRKQRIIQRRKQPRYPRSILTSFVEAVLLYVTETCVFLFFTHKQEQKRKHHQLQNQRQNQHQNQQLQQKHQQKHQQKQHLGKHKKKARSRPWVSPIVLHFVLCTVCTVFFISFHCQYQQTTLFDSMSSNKRSKNVHTLSTR